jgi:hypothetical protein
MRSIFRDQVEPSRADKTCAQDVDFVKRDARTLIKQGPDPSGFPMHTEASSAGELALERYPVLRSARRVAVGC